MNWKERICYSSAGVLVLGAGGVFIVAASVWANRLQELVTPVTQSQWVGVSSCAAVGFIVGFIGLWLIDRAIMGRRIGY